MLVARNTLKNLTRSLGQICSVFPGQQRTYSTDLAQTDDVVDLTMKLIDVESITENEKPMAEALTAWLEPRGWKVEWQHVHSDRHNVLAYREGCFKPHEKSPSVLFNSHIDTVPPFFPASKCDTYVHGRGACDTKGLIASQLLAGQRLVDEGINDVGFLYVVGEETDHCGIKAANSLGINPAYMITGEPTESKMVTRQKGIMMFTIECFGKPAHSGYPHLGDNALHRLLDCVEDIRQEHWPGDDSNGFTTVNFIIPEAGVACNIVPEYAKAQYCIRLVSDWEDFINRVKEIVGDRGKIELITANNPHDMASLPGYETQVVSFGTDIPYFEFDGKAILYGAGDIRDAHTAHERIKIDDLHQLKTDYYNIARSLIPQ